jgi:hypothetical protein
MGNVLIVDLRANIYNDILSFPFDRSPSLDVLEIAFVLSNLILPFPGIIG